VNCMSLEVRKIPIHDLEPFSNPIRSDSEINHEFVNDIRSGIRTPLLVRPIRVGSEQKYEIVTGMRRYEAALKARLSEVPCIVRELSDDDAYFEVIRENYQREDVNPADLSEYIRQGRDQMKLTPTELSEKLNIPKPDIDRWLRISEDPVLLKGLREHKISKDNAFEIISLKDRLQSLITGRKLTSDQASQILREATNSAAHSTITQLRREISNDLKQFQETESQSSLFESDLSLHDRVIERYFANLSSEGAEVEKSWFKPDLIAKLSPEQQKQYAARYLWLEIVDTNPPTNDKIRHLMEILGKDWRIMVYDIKSNKETLFP
jgi:ParB family transcriptional regulator, chromosome partitioning protein